MLNMCKWKEIRKEERKVGRKLSQLSWMHWLQVSNLDRKAKMSEKVSWPFCYLRKSEELQFFSGRSILPPITVTESRGCGNEFGKSWFFLLALYCRTDIAAAPHPTENGGQSIFMHI